MNVKKLLNQFKGLKNSKLPLLVLLVFILVLAVSNWKQAPEKPWVQDRVEIGLRQVGDQVMRRYGDQETPIPPIERSGLRAFRLHLSQAVPLIPDDLIDASFGVFDATYFEKALIQVYNDQSEEMVYGFNLDTDPDEEVPCLGRVLPKGDYYVQLTILDPVASANFVEAAIMGATGFALIIMLFSRISGPHDQKKPEVLVVAGMQLEVEKGILYYQESQVQLTQKELRLAEILMRQAGELVTRDYLIEEVWSKEGVVTGRSLDVFISRLRKKMAIHSKLQIVNKHGQGYVLETREEV